MKRAFLFLCFSFFPVIAEEFGLTKLWTSYLDVFKAAQYLNTTQKNKDSFLSLLKEYSCHQESPSTSDDSPIPNSRLVMHNTVAYHLGELTRYLVEVTGIISAFNVVIIKYFTQNSGAQPQVK